MEKIFVTFVSKTELIPLIQKSSDKRDRKQGNSQQRDYREKDVKNIHN